MLAPVVQVDDVIYGDVEAFKIPDLLSDFLATEQAKSGEGDADGSQPVHVVGEVRICVCSSCTAGGSFKVFEELKKVVGDMGLPARVKKVACKGFSFETPMVEISVYNGNRYRYGLVKPTDVRGLLLKHFRPASWPRRAGATGFHLLDDALRLPALETLLHGHEAFVLDVVVDAPGI